MKNGTFLWSDSLFFSTIAIHSKDAERKNVRLSRAFDSNGIICFESEHLAEVCITLRCNGLGDKNQSHSHLIQMNIICGIILVS